MGSLLFDAFSVQIVLNNFVFDSWSIVMYLTDVACIRLWIPFNMRVFLHFL